MTWTRKPLEGHPSCCRLNRAWLAMGYDEAHEFAREDRPLSELGECDCNHDEMAHLAKRVDHLEKVESSLRAELDISKSFHDIAVKERDLERIKYDRLESENKRLTAAHDALFRTWEEDVGNDGRLLRLKDAEIADLTDRLEKSEDSERESVEMYRRCRDERDQLKRSNEFLLSEAEKFEGIAVSHADAMRRALREMSEGTDAYEILARALGEK